MNRSSRMPNVAFSVVFALSAGGVRAQQPVAVGPAGRTNVVLIMTDDQGAWSLGCYGNPEARTPTLDRLAAEGVRLTQAFAATPVCSPSRATFLTGRVPSQHGIHDWIKHENMGPRARYCLRPDEVTLSEVLARHGYVCGLTGKWHLGDSLHPHAGFTYWFAMPQGSSRYQDAEMIWDGKLVETTGYITDRITDRAIEFLDAHRDRPFFLSVQYNAPHTPYEGHPKDMLDLYADSPFASIPRLPVHPWASADFGNIGRRESLQRYFAACSGVDRAVGRILAQLDKLDLAGRTLVVYTSDQGFNVGHHGLWGKGNASNPRNMYDTSLRVPMIFRHAGMLPKGRTLDDMVSAYDFVPTILDYVGLPPSPGRNLPGRSIAPALRGAAMPAREAIFGEYGHARMIRTREWKYVHRANGGPHELYDLKNDPDETKNLVDAPEHRALRTRLRTELLKWFSDYGEAGADPVGQEYLRPEDR